jgi:hypothetical protein
VPQYFHRRWAKLSQLVFFGGPLYALAIVGVLALSVRSPYATRVGVPVQQPIAFSHRHHVGQLKIDCRYCHESVARSSFAGIPSTEVCMGCHAELWRGLSDVESVVASYRTRIPLAWRRVHDLPDFASFDHSIHIQKGIGCVTCHGRVDQMPLIEQSETLRMQWCLECHRHPERFVRPREYVFDVDWSVPDDPASLQQLAAQLNMDPPATRDEFQRELVDLYRIRRQTSCSNCHQ